MRHFVLILLAILFGLALGLGGTVIELGASPSGTVARDLTLSTDAAPVDLSGPHIAIEQTEFNFGSMERDIIRSHRFELKNSGGKPLTLERGAVSCGRCILDVTFSKMPVPPSETAEATITWKTTTMGDFRHSADVMTNDPSRPQIQFTIVGKVMNSFRVSPEELVFSGASATKPTTAELRIYLYRGDQIEVVGHKFPGEENSDKFELRVEPLTAEQLQEDAEAKGGVAVFVTVNPGMPSGPFTQRLELTLNLPGSPVVDIPVRGNVVSDVQVVGDVRGWDSDTGILSLGMISRREGAKIKLTLQARGSHAKELQPVLKSADPDFLKVTFGQRKEFGAGNFVQIPMMIEIPAESRPIVRLGGKQGETGEVVIDTGHPDAKTLRIPVRFGVSD